jgi:hypothetical protein
MEMKFMWKSNIRLAKKVKPMVLPLLSNHEENVQKASMQPNLRDPRKVGYEFPDTTLDGLKVVCEDFLMKTKERCFKEMILCHGGAFAFESHKIGCVNPTIVAPMVIVTISHIP